MKQKEAPVSSGADDICVYAVLDDEDDIEDGVLLGVLDCSWSFLKHSRTHVLNSGEADESCLQSVEMHFSKEKGDEDISEDCELAD